MFQDKTIGDYSFNTRNVIGVGGFGQVFLGYHHNQTKVAIKTIKKSKILEDKYLASALVNEISILRKLSSEFIVKFLDTCESPTNYYIVQEYCEEGDLKRYLKDKKKLSEREALSILTSILSGYEVLIKNGIVHRDIKPANILISSGGYKLADFGFATSFKNMLDSHVGTPYYMSPQVLQYEKYTNKCDIWSIGVLYYECLCGQRMLIFQLGPWIKSTNLQEFIEKIKTEPLVFPSGVSEQSKDFIRKCLQFHEKDRIDWNNIYCHSLVNWNKFSQLHEDQTQYLINNLRYLIKSKDIDIVTEFSKLKQKKYISSQELFIFLRSINSSLGRLESDMIFRKFNENNNLFIPSQRLECWFNINEIQTTICNKFHRILQPSLTEVRRDESELEEVEDFQVAFVQDPFSGPGEKILALCKGSI